MSTFFAAGAFSVMNGVFNYLQDAYPEKAASILAGNDFVSRAVCTKPTTDAPFAHRSGR